MSIQFINTNKALISSETYKMENNLNTDSLYSYFIIDSVVLYSDDLIVFTNTRSVYILTLKDFIDVLKYDKKFFDYINVTDEEYNKLLHTLTMINKFTMDTVTGLFKRCSRLTIVVDAQPEDYLLNHYMKEACKLKLRDIMRCKEDMKMMDPDGMINSLATIKMNIDVITLRKSNGKKIVWAYLNVRKDANGFYYPVLNILDINSFSVGNEPIYTKYFVPDYILSNIFSKQYPLELDIKDEDMLWSNKICPKCKFNKISDIHNIICDFLYTKIRAF